ncbi:MAG TPA: 4Fe-4S dicluster domain-containing protein [Thermoplasmata archaeon]
MIRHGKVAGRIPMNNVLVVGGGPAGLAAAKSLTDRGSEVILVEKTESLGGMARHWTCKGLVECRNCGVCYVVDRANEVLKDPSVETLLLSEVISANEEGGSFAVRIKSSPRYVNDDCIGCGKCVEVCPVKGKAIFPPSGNGQPRLHWIDRSKCLHFKKAKCDRCASVCPTKAVDYEDRARKLTRKVSAVVYATGIQAVEACETTRLGCGVLQDVISSVDAEKMLGEKGRLTRPSDGKPPKKIAVVQCVGSRTVKNGVEYCSKFCCKYATKISQLLLDLDPEVNLDFYFMDLRTLYEPQDEFKTWAKGKKTVKLIRSMPASVSLGADGKLLVRSSGDTDLEIKEEPYDLVMLSVGMKPVGASEELARLLGIKPDSYGFAKRDEQLEMRGIFVAGALAEPMDIEEASVRAMALARRIARPKEAKA